MGNEPKPRPVIPTFAHNATADVEVKRQRDAERARRQAAEGTHLGYRWSRLRRGYLMQKPYCERCGLMADVVHHLLPRHTHPKLTYNWDNLMSLCHHCHDREHNMGTGS